MSLSRMITAAVEEIARLSKGKTSQKLVVHIREKKVPKGAAKTKSKGKKQKMSDSDDDSEAKTKEKSIAEWQVKLKAVHLCPKCTTHPSSPAYCYHTPGDPVAPCVPLSDETMTKWSAYLFGREEAGQAPVKVSDQALPPVPPAAPQFPQQFPQQYPQQFPYPMPVYPPYYAPHGHSFTQQPSHCLSESPKKAILITMYPTVSDWLVSLDNSDRGADNDNFAQYESYFKDHGYR
ncbi:hypothetical protein C8J56DRAFT_1051197 [Mycena floridula]|nr:hypothetical protein C8J56DRAFT_1051197 [Mycena floridula]